MTSSSILNREQLYIFFVLLSFVASSVGLSDTDEAEEHPDVRVHKISIADAETDEPVERAMQKNFAPLGQRTNLGIRDNPVWVRYQATVENIGKNKMELHFFPNTKKARIHRIIDNQIVLLGEVHGQDENYPENRIPYLPMNSAQEGWYDLLIYYESNVEYDVGFVFQSHEQAEKTEASYLAAEIFFVGFVTAIIIYNLFLTIAFKDLSYFLYIIFCTLSVSIVSMLGNWDFLLFRIEPSFRERLFPLIGALAYAFLHWFLIDFLSLRKELPRIFQIVRALGVLFIVNGLLGFSEAIPHSVVVKGVVFLHTVSVIATFLAISLLFKSKSSARYLLVGFMSLAFFSSIWFMANIGYIENSIFTDYSLSFGLSLDMVFMAMGLGARYTQLKIDKKEAEVTREDNMKLGTLVRVLCHDIGNPLSVAMGHAELNLKKELPKEQVKKSWKAVHRASKMQANIIEEVKKALALKSGEHQISLEAVPLESAIADMTFVFEDKLKNKDLSLLTEIPEGTPSVLAEPGSLQQSVLNNLMSNAIKFSPKGKRIFISTVTNKDMIEIRVRDEGIGIPEDVMPVLFEHGSSTSRPGTEGEKGTGFGMPVVKQFVEAYGGSIEVVSPVSGESNGTEFIVKLKSAA